MVNYATLENKTFFRLVLCNNQTTVADLERFFADVIETGRTIEKEDSAASTNMSGIEKTIQAETAVQAETATKEPEKTHVQVKQMGKSPASSTKETLT